MERRKPIAKHEAKPTMRVFIERLGRQPLSPDMPTAAVAARPVKLDEEDSSPIKALKSIPTNDQGDWQSSNVSESERSRCRYVVQFSRRFPEGTLDWRWQRISSPREVAQLGGPIVLQDFLRPIAIGG